MQKIITYQSASGNTEEIQMIYSDEPNIRSLASLILLKNYYKINDVDYIRKEEETKEYLKSRHIFLNKKIKSDGDLVCHYCGKKHLEIGFEDITYYQVNRANKNLATIDHKIPVSSGYNKFDISNWLVSCRTCNKMKSNSDYNTFLKNPRLIKRKKLISHKN